MNSSENIVTTVLVISSSSIKYVGKINSANILLDRTKIELQDAVYYEEDKKGARLLPLAGGCGIVKANLTLENRDNVLVREITEQNILDQYNKM